MIDFRHGVLQVADGLRGADACHHVLTGGVGQILPEEMLLPVRGVAGEGDTGTGGVPEIAKNHRLDADSGAQVIVDVVHFPVDDGPGGVPGQENRLDGMFQLLERVLGKSDQGLELGDNRLPVLGRHLGVQPLAMVALVVIDDVRKFLIVGAQHHIGVHVDEAAVGVVGEPAIPGLPGKALDNVVVHPQVQDGIHHPRHGDRRA